VLFSEPKIPQSRHRQQCQSRHRPRFSALQRAENSSIVVLPAVFAYFTCFSALQRAENSSIKRRMLNRAHWSAFQCSSASRKFLNAEATWIGSVAVVFQCSSASRKFLNCLDCAAGPHCADVSVLFSEPKIPQSASACACASACASVSVLFSEPKIPQF